MAAIQRYHDEMATYEAWAQGKAAPGTSGLADLLADPDAEIRRAAALSLGALGTKEALPTLVRLAKEDPEPRVREAALRAVERLAK
jgi:HEAT repeat protein